VSYSVIGIAAALIAALGVPSAAGAERKPFQAQSSSTISHRVIDGEETVEITNVAYEVSGDHVPGRPPDERMVLRKTTHTKEVIGDIGMDAKVMLEAWPLGVDLQQKPLYTIAVDGVDSHIAGNALLVVERGTEEVSWWSLYKLGNGRHLFDTYVPLLEMSISRETLTPRYVGLEVPPDDTPDARLKAPRVVAVLTYAAADRVIREALLTCDDPGRAKVLRSYSDASRTVSLVEGPGRMAVRVRIVQSYPAAPAPVEVLIPLANDDLDLTRAQLPPGLHVSAWRR
jgi:hypothetical protein